MPFVTEELWQHLPGVKSYSRKESIMICQYPSPTKMSSSFIGLVLFWLGYPDIMITVETENLYNFNFFAITAISPFPLHRAGPTKEWDTKWALLPAFALCQNDEVAEIIRSCELEILTLLDKFVFRVPLSGLDTAPAACAFENENLKEAGVVEEDYECTWISIKGTIAY
ncbi:Methionyl/Valyl/Leucyl/Isoleucyl-tRNA synthetase [Theobroma cacao]|nr:Methionyl/Valyl/Leucyl/Isoleucyl-tRNA synthetase [Theobroma cacao]